MKQQSRYTVSEMNPSGMKTGWIERLGRLTLERTAFSLSVAGRAVSGLRHLPATTGRGRYAVGPVLLRQIYFTAVQALPVATVLALLIGIVIISQIIRFAGHGSESLTGHTLVWIVVRSVGPLLAAIIVVARSGTAVATELATMQVAGEVASLRLMGIDPDRYLVMPRLAGLGLSAFVLTLYIEVVALLGGILVASFFWKFPVGSYGMAVLSSLTLADLAVSVFKGVLTGLGVAAICCHEGLRVGSKRTAVPQAATRAVMKSLFFVFLLDGLLSLLFFYT